jgi:Tfp pilus assembly protein PilO
VADPRKSPLDFLHERWKPISLVLLAVSILDLAAYLGVIRGIVRTSGNSEVVLATEQAKADKARDEVVGLERITSKLACTRSDVERVFDQTLSYKNDRMTRIQREVRDLARAHQLDPDQISYSTSPLKDTGLVRFQISFPLDGRYVTLQDFIKEVEQSPNFLIVDSVNMQESLGQDLKLQIRLVTYFQAPDVAEEASAQGVTAASTVPAASGGRT